MSFNVQDSSWFLKYSYSQPTYVNHSSLLSWAKAQVDRDGSGTINVQEIRIKRKVNGETHLWIFATFYHISGCPSKYSTWQVEHLEFCKGNYIPWAILTMKPKLQPTGIEKSLSPELQTSNRQTLREEFLAAAMDQNRISGLPILWEATSYELFLVEKCCLAIWCS